MTKKDVTNDDIMTALTQFAKGTDTTLGVIDVRLGSMDKRLALMDAKLAGVDECLARLDAEAARRTDTDRIYDILDAHMARIERMMEENSVQTHQQERLQRWVFQLADKAGVQLKYE